MKMDNIKGFLSFQQEIYCIQAAWTGIKIFDGTFTSSLTTFPLLKKGSETRKAVY